MLFYVYDHKNRHPLMGYIRHHAIVVTGFDEKIGSAWHIASVLFAGIAPVTPVTDEVVNGYRSFAVLPDGSKEGWEASAEGDDARAEFIDWMRQQENKDGSSPWSWVEMQYGDDEHDTKVVVHSDEPNGSECRPYPKED